ncbi:MAG: hypothetical protein ACRDPR_15080 [Nocardioidaceae bacterium]
MSIGTWPPSSGPTWPLSPTCSPRRSGPPCRWTLWFAGREAVMAALTESWNRRSPHYIGRYRMVSSRANGQPAVAAYLQAPGDDDYRAFNIGVLRIEGGRIAEVVAGAVPDVRPAADGAAPAPVRR